jgi:NAD(P)-dependent dehydrogenase (short-subunit alcohol dehydrogenase family)
MDQTSFHGQCALVTGAASGIGKATALAFAAAGADIIACDISEERLAETAAEVRALGRRVLTQRVDVSDKEQMRAFAARVHEDHEAVDILVNNAGVALAAGFLETSLEDWEWIVSINLWGVIYGCHFFLPNMVKRGRGGHVVNISSIAGIFGMGVLNAYTTTKFGVFGLSESLRDELSPHRIGVTTVCPGFINTPIMEATEYRGAQAAPEMIAHSKKMVRKRNYSPERVGACILDGVRNNVGVLPVTPEAWAIYGLKRMSPGLMAMLGRKLTTSARERAKQDGPPG